MNKYEIIADKIEEVISYMFRGFSAFDPKASEYAMFYNPSKCDNWFVVIYFADNTQLKEALQNGTCYQMHQFLAEGYEELDELRGVNYSISFESGKRPVSKEKYDEYLAVLVEKHNALIVGKGQGNIEICHGCGHDFNNHQLLGFPDEESGQTKEGWMMCPEAECNCFMTWDANYGNER